MSDQMEEAFKWISHNHREQLKNYPNVIVKGLLNCQRITRPIATTDSTGKTGGDVK